MSEPVKKTVSRILSRSEAQYLFELFEDIHCHKQIDGVEVKCPGWNWDLECLDDQNQPIRGGCVYKNSNKLCSNLEVAAKGMFVLDIRPKNDDDIAREREIDRTLLEQELRRLRTGKMALDEQILALENKMRNL